MSRFLRSRAGSQDGFTLIEMMVVLLIVAMAAAVAMPRIGRQAQRLDAAASTRAQAVDMLRALVLPDDPRLPLEYRVLRARHLGDLWDLRSQLFGAISLAFGEHVARERLQRLDAQWH